MSLEIEYGETPINNDNKQIAGITVTPRQKNNSSPQKGGKEEGTGSIKIVPRGTPLVNPNYPTPDLQITSPLSPESFERLAANDKISVFLDKFFFSNYRIYQDCEGKITQIFMQYSKYEKGCDAELGELKAYKTILLNTGEDVKITILVNTKEDKEVIEKLIKETKIKNPDRVKVITTGKIPRGWARDSALPVTGDDLRPNLLLPGRLNTLVIESYRKKDPNCFIPEIEEVDEDQAMFGFINDIDIRKLKDVIEIILDGGNIIRLGRKIFVGRAVVYNTHDALWCKYQDNADFDCFVRQYYKELTGKEAAKERNTKEILLILVPNLIASFFNGNVVVIGEDNPATEKVEAQPTFHIDMLMGAAKDLNGEEVVLVGDPKMAKEIFDKLSAEEKEKNANFKTMLDDGKNNLNINEKQNNFDAVAEYLKKQGFKVVRVPYLDGLGNILPTVSFTNKEMEDYIKDGKHIKRVFLPQYNIESLDKEAVRIYKEMGYEIIPIDSSEISRYNGSIRCKTQMVKDEE